MTSFSFRAGAGLFAALGTALASGTVAAGPVSPGISRADAAPLVVQAGYDDDRTYSGRRYRRGDRVVVDAPTTYVEQRRGRVTVDAPYAHVDRSSRGVRVIAPFVDIYVRR